MIFKWILTEIGDGIIQLITVTKVSDRTIRFTDQYCWLLNEIVQFFD